MRLFTKIENRPVLISPIFFFWLILSLLSFWESNCIFITLIVILPQVTEALFILFYFKYLLYFSVYQISIGLMSNLWIVFSSLFNVLVGISEYVFHFGYFTLLECAFGLFIYSFHFPAATPPLLTLHAPLCLYILQHS